MKKYFVLLIIFLLMFSGCAPTEPYEEPNPMEDESTELDNDSSQLQNNLYNNNTPNELEKPDLDTQESSIFKQDDVKNCRITANIVDVLNGVGNTFGKIGTLNKNDEVKVLEQIGNWYIVQLDNNLVGAIDASKATPIVKEGEDHEDIPIQQPQTGQQEQQSDVDQTQPDSNTQSPTSENNAEPLSEMEQQMVDLVNSERSKNGLSPLTVDLELARVAEIKSQDMAENNYFSHNSPTYGSPFDMMKDFGIDYLAAGENLAGNSSVEGAHTGLMNSSGHRKNILKPEFTHIGIGIRPSDKYGYLFTQMFISKPN